MIQSEDQIRDAIDMIGRYYKRPLGKVRLVGLAISQIDPMGIHCTTTAEKYPAQQLDMHGD